MTTPISHTAITNALALKANIDGAPANRDTLDQLYDVLNAAIALKANIASPTFTGNREIAHTFSRGRFDAHRDDRVATGFFRGRQP